MAENAELHAQLVDQAREAGVVEERQRLAGEIHDTLAQGLTGIIAQLRAAEHTRHAIRTNCRATSSWHGHWPARVSPRRAGRYGRFVRSSSRGRACLTRSTPSSDVWSQQSMVAPSCTRPARRIRYRADIEAALFRVAQEALSNVAKHAKASKVRLTLTYLDDTVLLDVADDGERVRPGRPDRRDTGWSACDERLARVGGTLTVESAPGYGTTLNAAFPWPLGAGGARDADPAADRRRPPDHARRAA